MAGWWCLIWDTYHHGSSSGEFLVWDFCFEFEMEAQADAFLKRGVVEEVDYVSSKTILEPAALVEIERAGGIDFQVFQLANEWAELALELQRAGSYLRHGEG